MVLVTTRDNNVADVVKTIPAYKLGLLSKEDSWSLFVKCAYLSTKSKDYLTLEHVGRELVRKCKGLPLAVKALGSLLRTTNNDEIEWDSVLKSELREVFEDRDDMIIPSLRISYHYLPSNLKRCFVYCSLLPKDCVFDKDELVLLWMAEELLQPKRRKNLEEIGCEYFDQLVARVKDVRTFLEVTLGRKDPFNMENAPHIFSSQLNCLRVLSFNTFPLYSLPDSIGELIHLRYLDLSYTPITTLPDELCNLYNLQTLKLKNYRWLKKLPNNMQDLVNLRHLDIEGAGIEEMPKGISKMKNLQFLSDYIVSKHAKNNGIEELGALANIQKSLRICQLENIIDGDQALEAKITEKKNIRCLDLTWSSNGDMVDSQDILNNLRPHTNLRAINRRHLCLCNLYELRHMRAEFYKYDEASSSCGAPFPMLENLSFSNMDCWEEWLSVSSEFELDAFPKLKVLDMENYPKLKGDLPSKLPALETLRIERCDQFGFALPRADGMLELSVDGSQQVEAVFEAIARNQLNSLQNLNISNCDSSISFPGACLPSSLQNLDISCCPYLEFPKPPPQQHESLQLVSRHNSCNSLTSFTLASFLDLTTLTISSCKNMRSLEAASISSLRSLRIDNCPIF
ncbi:hypothetical protein PIB30_078696 [Stylosanthes scabra]|uniref:Disease resistance RPP13-like protein 1 n=1 Tax=Stylosanthes scabra TaxID=79078 RepID=A0ABU6TRL0_9FABA|nr:hypothetical protein [Stylosanthes scabra]